MALNLKNIEKNGITTNYHMIKKISIMPIDSENMLVDEDDNIIDTIRKRMYLLTVEVKSYISEDYRRISEGNAIFGTSYSFKIELSEIDNVNVFNLAYNKLKTTEKFKLAEDC